MPLLQSIAKSFPLRKAAAPTQFALALAGEGKVLATSCCAGAAGLIISYRRSVWLVHTIAARFLLTSTSSASAYTADRAMVVVFEAVWLPRLRVNCLRLPVTVFAQKVLPAPQARHRRSSSWPAGVVTASVVILVAVKFVPSVVVNNPTSWLSVPSRIWVPVPVPRNASVSPNRRGLVPTVLVKEGSPE